jgi:5-methylcytosine-specific restriction endonuclease McrA
MSALKVRWKAEEDELVREHYAVLGSSGLRAELPGRTLQAIESRAKGFGINHKVKWSVEEDEILRAHYTAEGTAGLTSRLPGRNVTSIRRRAHELGVPGDRSASLTKAWVDRIVAPVIERDGVKGKACTKCLEWKPLESFGLHATCKGGRRNVCGPCEAAAHPYKHEDYAKFRSDRIRRAKEWKEANPEKVRATASKSYAKRMLALSDGEQVSAEQINDLFALYEGRCAYCRVNKATTIDHVKPLARGGKHTIGNLLPACVSCNCSKGALPLDEWARRFLKRS